MGLDPDPPIVYVSTNADTRNASGVYHTDEECHRVELGNMREVYVRLARGDMGLSRCKHCAGEVDRSHTGPTLANQIEGAAE